MPRALCNQRLHNRHAVRERATCRTRRRDRARLRRQRRSLLVSLPGAFLVWLTLALFVHAVPWSFAGAAALNLAVLPICMRLARPLRDAGLDRVNVSLDTLSPETFVALARRDRLPDVLAGLAAAA